MTKSISNDTGGVRIAKTATGAVADALARDILAERRPGAKLESEAALSLRFGVSRVTVREALRTLAGKGLVELSRGRRATVRQPDGQAFGDFLASAIRFDPKGLFDLLEVRMSLEIQSVGLAAKRASRAGLAALEATLEGMREAAAAYDSGAGAAAEERFHRHDVGFHEALATATGNRVLVSLFEAMARPLEKSFAMTRRGRDLRGEPAAGTVAAHERILARVRAGDARGAAEAMRAHLEESERDIRAAFDGADGGFGERERR